MANLRRCQQQQLQKKSVRIRKGKRVVKPSKQMDIVDHQALISDPYFNLKHLTKNNQKLLVCQSWPGWGDMERTIKFSFYSSPLSNVQQLNSCLSKYVQELDCPSTFKPNEGQLFCSFNGLVVLGFYSYSTFDQQLYLWNPSTRESTLLPHSEFTQRWTMIGFGCDATSDGYKLLKWTVLKGGHSIQVLSLKSGSWRNILYRPTTIAICPGRGRKLPIFPYLNDNWYTDPMVFVHGAFHWLGMTVARTYHLVSFNSSNEVYGEIPLLEQMHITNE
uniref:F-box/kelch-repeat protein At3g23880-like n=1 Tax=Nicotiana tabacum TaxID=4097 RepID=A0A1S3ZW80_TOBAC